MSSSTGSYRAVLRQPVSRRRELALQFAVLVGLAIMGGLVIVVGVVLHRGDAELGRQQARAELTRQLQPRETVLLRIDVTQHHWYDHFRVTPGVLAATDSRLLLVSTAPPALFRAVGDDPPTFLVRSFVYDTALTVHADRVLAGTTPGIVVDSGGSEYSLAVDADDRSAVQTVVRLVDDRRSALLADYERQQALRDSIMALPPPPPVVHRVVSGETLYGLARLYNVTPEVLKAMNGLTSDQIRIGDELVVRRYRRINGVVMEYYGPPE